jgi:O-succinylbenzoic acid--CoA ligase
VPLPHLPAFPVGELTGVELKAGPIWREVLERVWGDGGAVLPLDPALPRRRRRELLEAARPQAVLGRDGTERLAGSDPVAPDTALVVPTSGSAGAPKLVELGRPAIHAAVRASCALLGATADNRWLCCLPLHHIGGLLVVLRAIALGADLEILERFDVEAIGSGRTEFVSVVPTMLVRALDAGRDLSRYRAVLVGGARLDPRIRERAADATLVQTYGMTETTGGVVYDGVPLPRTEVRIAEDTEIQLRGPTLMTGYRGDAGRTTAAFTEDRWLRTRDAGTLEPDGRLNVVGRLDRAITTGGVTVHPRPIESVLRAHPKVADAVVVARPDPEWGQRVTAIVQPVDPLAPPTLDELRAFAADRLPVAAIPRSLEIVPRPEPAAGGAGTGDPKE